MIEMLFEYTLSVIDYSYLLFFYLRLINKKWEWKKAVPAILGIAVVQFVKEHFLDFGGLSLVVDDVLIIFYLFLYSRRYIVSNFINAMIVDGIFTFTIVFLVSCTMEAGIYVDSILTFGIERIVFSALLKIFTIIIFLLASNFLKKLYAVMEDKSERIMVFIMSMILIVFAYIFGNAENNHSIFWYTILISIIMISVFYLFYRYCLALKVQADNKIIKHAINITSDYVNSLEKEHEEIKMIRHDIRNQLSALEYIIEHGSKEEVKDVLNDLSNKLDVNRVSISGNIYVDAILRQKMNEYKDINFDLHIELTKDFNFDGNDLISLLSNIIDNACEELRRINKDIFYLSMRGDASKLLIKEHNECRTNNSLKTNKDCKYHGYGIKIIDEIVRKHDGIKDMSIKNNVFTISIMITII